ncbi:MAG: DEAD/DEAH box helicase [Alkalibacterium sp.]|nr:DEAD/DEAH box helicase [Alkalibacterium sp.]
MSKDYLLYGRDLIFREVHSAIQLTDRELTSVNQRPAISRINGRYRCERCGAAVRTKKPYPCICGGNCLYCSDCLILGKVRACDTLITLEEPNLFAPVHPASLRWIGCLSEEQRNASIEISRTIHANEERVVWAVTGAGKTEMLFEGVGKALDANKRVCIATPRVDVCLELAPRLRQAFPDTSLAVLYGSAEEKYTYTQLVIATTHQLLRFKEAFDVLIIDEIDAFPFYLNDMLYYAAAKAIKQQSSTIYLTATPDRLLKKRIKAKKIKASILPARYHGHPLPVPSLARLSSHASLKKIDSNCYQHMQELLNRKKRFLVFIPTIQLMEDVMKKLVILFSQFSFDSVHSKDSQRKEKVSKMRLGQYDFLVTTTILERGVTLSGIDVIVLMAEHRVYTEAALVQIAGRAGRSKEYPNGEVTFYCTNLTRGIKGAVREIKEMNRLASRKGLLK